MTITIELSPEEEARLREQAKQRGQAVETVAHSLVQAGLPPTTPTLIPKEAHAVLIQRLRDAGLLTTLPTYPGQTMPFQPVTVLGSPVSQTLLEDRA